MRTRDTHTMRIRTFILAVASLGLLAGCGESQGTAIAPTATPAPAAALPADLFVDSIEGEPIGPVEAKANLQAGDEVVLTGTIGGRARPFVQERAVFTLVDGSLPLCDNGVCPTAWDACCEPPEQIQATAATVQVVDDAGKPLAAGLQGPDKLAPMARLVIAGEVKQNDENAFVVNARRIAKLPAN